MTTVRDSRDRQTAVARQTPATARRHDRPGRTVDVRHYRRGHGRGGAAAAGRGRVAGAGPAAPGRPPSEIDRLVARRRWVPRASARLPRRDARVHRRGAGAGGGALGGGRGGARRARGRLVARPAARAHRDGDASPCRAAARILGRASPCAAGPPGRRRGHAAGRRRARPPARTARRGRRGGRGRRGAAPRAAGRPRPRSSCRPSPSRPSAGRPPGDCSPTRLDAVTVTRRDRERCAPPGMPT